MVHCNPAPPHPPPGEIYNVICMGRPYIEGFPVGYVMVVAVALLPLVSYALSRKRALGENDG